MSARTTVVILVVILVFYLVIAGAQAVALIGSGELVAMGLGIGILILPLIGLWIIWRELQFGFGVQKMARQLEAEGGLPVDNCGRCRVRPRRAGDASRFGQLARLVPGGSGI